jgi:hypothetical protein
VNHLIDRKSKLEQLSAVLRRRRPDLGQRRPATRGTRDRTAIHWLLRLLDPERFDELI